MATSDTHPFGTRRSLERRRDPSAAVVLVWLAVVVAVLIQPACGWRSRGSGTLPSKLSDSDFWALTMRLSEAPGAFHSDNLVSNEMRFAHNVRMLRAAGGVYVGVGPEQNFSYIARVRPAMAFIIDIRQENRSLHLLYKVLFELAADRAGFLSMLFSRERPGGVGTGTSVEELFARYDAVKPDARLHDANLRDIRDRLLGAHRFPLPPEDLNWIEYAFRAFYTHGPNLHYGQLRPDDSPRPSYRTLMTATDLAGNTRSFLSTEQDFAFVKDLHDRNMIVPVIGDFAGADALRRAGEYLREHHAVVSAFYASNVEVYLTRVQRIAFCRNLTALPYGSGSSFIGSKVLQPYQAKLDSCLSLLPAPAQQ